MPWDSVRWVRRDQGAGEGEEPRQELSRVEGETWEHRDTARDTSWSLRLTRS